MSSQSQNVVVLFSWNAKTCFLAQVLLLFFYLTRMPVVDFVTGMLTCNQSEPVCSYVFQLEYYNLLSARIPVVDFLFVMLMCSPVRAMS